MFILSTMIKSKIKPLASTTNSTRNHCGICDKFIIGNSYKLRAHLYQHSVVKSRFECPYCYKEFFRADAFTRHINVHTGNQKTYVCDYCERSFVDKRNLLYHLKVHDDSLPLAHQRCGLQFKCEACGVVYCELRLLRNHIRRSHFNLKAKEEMHLKKTLNETWVENVKDSKVCVEMTKVNNNVITIKKCVKQEQNLLVKEQKTQDLTAMYSTTHYSKVICDYCNKEMLKKSLAGHIRERHFNVRKFVCEVCKRTFKRHYQLVDHACGKEKRHRKPKGVDKQKISETDA